MNKALAKGILVAAFFCTAPGGARAAERTEVHWNGATITAKALAEALAGYISAETAVKGGVLLLSEGKKGKAIALTPKELDKGGHIHWLGKGLFLSWGVFSDAKGVEYLVDFYLEWTGQGLKFNAPATIYSVAGKKRYQWDESGEFMVKKPQN